MSISNQVTSKKRALVIAPFFSIGGATSRPRFVGSVLAELMPVDLLTSDFDHGRKERIERRSVPPFDDVVYINTREYRNNVGPGRMLSHLLFAFSAATYFRRNRDRYDVIYVTAPLNVLAWLVFTLSKRATKIIDVVDIWPDVLPFSLRMRRSLAPVFKTWKWFFKSAVFKADVAIGVSDQFVAEARGYARKNGKVRRYYLGHERFRAATSKQTVFTIAYVGNIGRLYDFDTLLDVLSEDHIRKRMQLFVIGKGDRQSWLLEELKRRKIRHQFFGVVFDPVQLGTILRSCHVGFNGYFNTTAAFSYKAGTYLAAGLPLVNSMTGDLQRLVAERGLGRNYEGGNRPQLSEGLLHLYRNGTASAAANCEEFFTTELDSSKIAEDMKQFFTENLFGVDELQPEPVIREDMVDALSQRNQS